MILLSVEKEIKEDSYFLQGLYGSKNDNEKLALSIKKGKFNFPFFNALIFYKLIFFVFI